MGRHRLGHAAACLLPSTPVHTQHAWGAEGGRAAGVLRACMRNASVGFGAVQGGGLPAAAASAGWHKHSAKPGLCLPSRAPFTHRSAQLAGARVWGRASGCRALQYSATTETMPTTWRRSGMAPPRGGAMLTGTSDPLGTELLLGQLMQMGAYAVALVAANGFRHGWVARSRHWPMTPGVEHALWQARLARGLHTCCIAAWRPAPPTSAREP